MKKCEDHLGPGTSQNVPISTLERGTGEHHRPTGFVFRPHPVPQRFEPWETVLVGQGNPRHHLFQVRRGMKVVGIKEFRAGPLGDKSSYRGLSASGNAHDDEGEMRFDRHQVENSGGAIRTSLSPVGQATRLPHAALGPSPAPTEGSPALSMTPLPSFGIGHFIKGIQARGRVRRLPPRSLHPLQVRR